MRFGDDPQLWNRAPFSHVLERVPSWSDWYHLMRATELVGYATGRSTQNVRGDIKLGRYDHAISNLHMLLSGPYGDEQSRADQSRERSADWRRWIAATGIHIPQAQLATKGVDAARD